MQPRPEEPVAETIITFILSPEFNDGVLQPALNNCLIRQAAERRSLTSWVRTTFDIEIVDDVGDLGLIASLLRDPWIAARIDQTAPYWPRGPLASRLQDHGRPASKALVRRIASGVTIADVVGIKGSATDGRVACESGHAHILFTLEDETTEADLVTLELGAIMSGGRSIGHLELDYGRGFEAADPLNLRSADDGTARVVLAGGRALRGARWFPSDGRSAGRLIRLAAGPATLAEALKSGSGETESAETLFGAALLRAQTWPGEGMASGLSHLLSPPPLTAYEVWLKSNEPPASQARELWSRQLAELQRRPLLSIVTPTYETPLGLLRDMLESVRNQVYPNWELCIADDASTAPHVREELNRYACQDERIRIVFRAENGHISAASNSALQLVRGDWTILLDHDDLLTANALLAVAREIESHPSAKLIYSDEDKLEGLARGSPYFKPDYSPELFLAQNYFNHLTAYRTDIVRDVGGWRRGFEGSQDYDLSLRVLERIAPLEVRHIPEVLYHWRAVRGSTAREAGEKGYALEAGRRALQEHLDRTRPGARAELNDRLPLYRVRPALPEPQPRVSLVIPTRDAADILDVAITSILSKSTYNNYEIIIVDNGSVEDETKRLFDCLSNDKRIRIVSYPGAFNYSAINNYAVSLVNGDIIGLINNDIEVLTSDWLEEMVSWAMQDGVGCVGAKLLYPDMTVQHAGVIVGLGGVAGHSHKHISHDDPGYFGRAVLHGNVSAVTAACLLVRREVFTEVGGLDEGLAVAFNDVDFCLRVREAGYRNVFTPHARLYHHESKSRGAENTPSKVKRFNSEIAFMKERWGELLLRDPFYSPNLTLDREDFSLGRSVWAQSAARL